MEMLVPFRVFDWLPSAENVKDQVAFVCTHLLKKKKGNVKTACSSCRFALKTLLSSPFAMTTCTMESNHGMRKLFPFFAWLGPCYLARKLYCKEETVI